MEGNKKEGVSVKEIEEFAKKHRYEVFFCFMFLLAFIFGIWGSFALGWNIFAVMAGAVVGVLMPTRVEMMLKKAFHFVFKQEKTLLIVLGVVALVLAVVIPLIVFLLIGANGGKAMHQMVSSSMSGM
jgi:hypothetical protein